MKVFFLWVSLGVSVYAQFGIAPCSMLRKMIIIIIMDDGHAGHDNDDGYDDDGDGKDNDGNDDGDDDDDDDDVLNEDLPCQG